MKPTQEQIDKMISCPSLGAVTYQACSVVRELDRINPEEYLAQACKIRDVFLCIVEYILEELWDLSKVTRAAAPQETVLARVRALGAVLHEIYSYIRYLWASSPQQSPPGIQVAVSQLTEMYFPKENGEPVSLVRPQWKYNLTYVPMSWFLRDLLNPSVFDPNGKLGARRREELLVRLWDRRRARLLGDEGCPNDTVPSQLAILSFAGLDTHDTLLYPLLAHELGHFIDFSFNPPLNLRSDLRQKAKIRPEQVRDILLNVTNTPPDPQQVSTILNTLVQQVYVAIREIIADLLATRMLGFSLFVAQAEFLKTLATWPQPSITPSGYPGIRFRLQIVFDHLISDSNPNSCLTFLRQFRELKPELATPLLAYLEGWKDRLKSSEQPVDNNADGIPTIQAQLAGLVEGAIRAVLEDLNALAREVIPDDRAARLTDGFFERIDRLYHELPPSCPQEVPQCFAEILSAGWAYQILHGEAQEAAEATANLQLEEYSKTCRLILKAVELTPTTSTTATNPLIALQACASTSEDILKKGGVLGAPHLATRLCLPLGHPQHLAVVPLSPEALKAASLDVHLGHWFVVARRTRLSRIRIAEPQDAKLLKTVGREEVFVPSEHTFLIHPGDLVLGATLEFIALPADVMAFVEGRSSLGRMGLIVATATQVAPGFHGVIVLEMVNAGTVPLEIKPEMPIAQLVLMAMTEPVPKDKIYRGRYHCQVHP